MMGDEIFILLGLLALGLIIGVPVLLIVSLVKLSDARARIEALERRVSGLEVRGASPSATATMPQRATPPAMQPTLPPALDPSPDDPAAPAVWGPEPAPLDESPAQPPRVAAPGALARLWPWLRENWVYVVSALSLALAGVFFVQYGIENGLLPPPVRVLAGIGFGAALIAAGEWLRRRFGSDEVADSTVYLPSVFSGAGLVAVFAAITAGRQMYGLYGPVPTFGGLVLTAAGAVLLGWRNGPLLVAIGLVGAAVAPFLVAGGSAPQIWLFGYYVLVAAIGLAVDAWRRWGWISVLALGLAHGGLWLMWMGGGEAWGWLAGQVTLALLAIILPGRRVTPVHAGPSLSRFLWYRGATRPTRDVWLAAGNMAAVAAQILVAPFWTVPEAMLAYGALAALALVLMWWAEGAEGLEDLAALPALAFVLRLIQDHWMAYEWRSHDIALRAPETAGPWTVTLLLGMAAAISAIAAWRALRGGSLPHTLGAVLVAPVAAGILEALWQPGMVMGAYPWALHVMGLAAGYVLLALQLVRADGGPGRRTAWATLAALSLIALSLFILTSAAALTLALGVLLVAAVALDRRFDLPEMGWFVQVGAAVLSWRLVIDPGLVWALDAPITAVMLAHLGVALACLAGLWLMPSARPLPRAVLESLGLAAPALLVNVLLLRWLAAQADAAGGWTPDYNNSHWGATLNALPWLVVAGVQLWRAGAAQGLGRVLRLVIAAGAGVLAATGLALAVVVFNPLTASFFDDGGRVLGPPVLNTLALAYAVPGLMLVFGAARMTVLPRMLVRALQLVGGALLVLYAVVAIRHLWQGPWIGGPGVEQGELYTYTVAMMVTGAVLLWQALARRSVLLQRVAMAVIGLTVAKVFLWDVSGLSGLMRVVSFAGLGLSLAGLAWLNRWAGQAMRGGVPGGDTGEAETDGRDS